MTPKSPEISNFQTGLQSVFQKLKDKLNEFRQELNSTLGSLEEETDEVYHLNIQLFPLSQEKP